MTAVAVPPQLPPRLRHMAHAAGSIRSITPKHRVDTATTAVRPCTSPNTTNSAAATARQRAGHPSIRRHHTVPLYQAVAQKPTGEIAGDPEQKWERCYHAHSLHRDVRAVHHPGGEPGKIKPAGPTIKAIGRGDEPKLRQGQKPAPGHAAMERCTALANLFQLRARNPRLIGRSVAKPRPPDNRPHQTHSAQYPEDGPPAKTYLQRDQGKRRHRRAQPARSPHHALAARSLLFRKPMRNNTGRIGVSAGRAHPKQKAGDEELPESAAPARERREDRPPGSNAASARHVARSDHQERLKEFQIRYWRLRTNSAPIPTRLP